MSKKNFYAVVQGRNPGIYKEWFGEQGAEAQVRGIAKSVYNANDEIATYWQASEISLFSRKSCIIFTNK